MGWLKVLDKGDCDGVLTGENNCLFYLFCVVSYFLYILSDISRDIFGGKNFCNNCLLNLLKTIATPLFILEEFDKECYKTYCPYFFR